MLTRDAPGKCLNRALEIVQRKAMSMHFREWIFTRFDQLYGDREGIDSPRSSRLE